MSICTAPGKIMLAGEYAVIDGSEAIMLAVNRQAVATIERRPQNLSPFLAAAHRVIAGEFGESSPQAVAAQCVHVDTRSFRENGKKLGLGSSAAATVAAVGAALGDEFSVEVVHRLARQAHGDAQEPSGTRGSGADVAACCFGGCTAFATESGRPIHRAVHLPATVHLVFPWCGQSASTTSLVPRVRALREAQRPLYERHCAAIAQSAQTLASAQDAQQAIAAIAAGGEAVAALGHDAQAPLWLPIHSQMQRIAISLGGALKPTGAGGGDLALGAFDSAENAQIFVQRLADQGIPSPNLAASREGVRLQPQASKVAE